MSPGETAAKALRHGGEDHDVSGEFRLTRLLPITAVALFCLLAAGCIGRHSRTSADGMKLLTERQLVTALQRHGIDARAFPKRPTQGEVATHVYDTFHKLFSSWHVNGGAVASKVEAFVTDSADHARDLSPKHPRMIFSRTFTVSNVVVMVFSPFTVDAVKAAMRDLRRAARP